MQSVRSRIWTRVAVSISYDDNHYTTGTSHCAKIGIGSLRSALTEERTALQIEPGVGHETTEDSIARVDALLQND